MTMVMLLGCDSEGGPPVLDAACMHASCTVAGGGGLVRGLRRPALARHRA
eukprot:COSAG01_NODE_19249_length_1022_cov_1.212351_2_plen_49_part_01